MDTQTINWGKLLLIIFTNVLKIQNPDSSIVGAYFCAGVDHIAPFTRSLSWVAFTQHIFLFSFFCLIEMWQHINSFRCWVFWVVLKPVWKNKWSYWGWPWHLHEPGSHCKTLKLCLLSKWFSFQYWNMARPPCQLLGHLVLPSDFLS